MNFFTVISRKTSKLAGMEVSRTMPTKKKKKKKRTRGDKQVEQLKEPQNPDPKREAKIPSNSQRN